MARTNLADLQAFVAVAQTRSFTRAAAQLDVSRSALSHAVSGLEARLGVRLLTRTTRSVSTTDAGERLVRVLAPRFEDIDVELDQLTSARDKPAGLVRITAHDHAIRTVLWPKLLPLMRQYPDIQIEISVDYSLTDIAAQRFDAGVRSGDQVDKDMVAVRIGPDFRMAMAASPGYFKGRTRPQTPTDLTAHRCINLRLPTRGNLYAWDLEKRGRSVQAKVSGQVVMNNTVLMLQAALDGLGICYVPEDLVQPHVKAGHLVPVLEDWWPRLAGYRLYYASRRQMSPAFALVVEALRNRGTE
ncbi:MAG TPA: LysR family transcriptional regulator [Burkholderiaceae bacterium]|nr:LysR family transcriptional regulator [Burkholderiaceae bacterium]